MVVPELPRRSGPQSSSDSQTESTENPLRRALKQSSSDSQTVFVPLSNRVHRESWKLEQESSSRIWTQPVLHVMSP